MTQDARNTIKLAVLGHTNAGKTSLLRTLTRDRSFGEVSIHPATTRHVETISMKLETGLAIEFKDTPGFEDSMGLLNILHDQEPDPRITGPIRLNHFLNTNEARTDFVQEAKALRQLMSSDLTVYVADATEPVSGKYTDEFVILNWSGKPCLVVLNFVAGAAHQEEWREALRNAGLHNVVEFDTVVYKAADEKRLLQQLALLLPAAEKHIQLLLELRSNERRQQIDSAAVLIAETLVECATIHATGDCAAEAVQQKARQREQNLNRDLLSLFRFSETDYAPDDLPIKGAQWSIDLFDPDVLSELGVRLGSSAAKGAAAGATIDLVTGFTSLGMATLIGGVIGTGIDGANRLKKYIEEKVDDNAATQVAMESLCFLARRACLLVQDLAGRGHAAVHPVITHKELGVQLQEEQHIIEILDRCRYQPDWISSGDKSKRTREIHELVTFIQVNLPAT